jgi:quercetin dioxygenase-like cupin family protein
MNPPHHVLGDPAELAALYLAGALSDADRAGYEAHLEIGCPTCDRELQALDATAALLAQGIAPIMPNPQVRENLLERIANQRVARVGRPTDARETHKASGGGQPVAPSEPSIRSPLGRQAEADTGRPSKEMIFNWAAKADWRPTAVPGVSMRVLGVDRPKNQYTALVRMTPGSAYPGHTHGGGEGCLVLEGDLRIGDDVMHAGDYQFAPAGSRHGVQSTEHGCLLLITSALDDDFA